MSPSKPRKCFPGFHKLVSKASAGIFAYSNLEQCSKCNWWRVCRLAGYDVSYYWREPGYYHKLTNKKSGLVVYVSIAQMRDKLIRSKTYGPSFAARVENMSDKAVYATYMRMLNAGKL